MERRVDGRFRKKQLAKTRLFHPSSSCIEEHNYAIGHTCEDEFWCDRCIPGISKLRNSPKIQLAGWDEGRRVVEMSVLVDELNSGCRRCGSGPLLLSRATILGEMKLGLGGYFYILCRQCRNINRIKYGKTHKTSKYNKGMPSFCVNTKLGAAMIDNVGGPRRTNNLMTSINIPSINARTLKGMERRAGTMIEEYAEESMKKECKIAFNMEMKPSAPSDGKKTGMTVCADHAWQKKGFDSLTGHTFVISKENKVLKAVVKHRTCGICKWWRRNKPGIRTRKHKCVWNHNGSARAMEAATGVQAIVELQKQGIGLKDNVNIEAVPVPVPMPLFSQVDQLRNKDPTTVILDLETTGLIQNGLMPHITQIAAEVQTTDTDVYNKETFSRYVVPKVPIAKQAQRVTGISFNGVEMTVRGQTVPVVNVKDALHEFLTWLESIPNVVLVAHNGRNFDFRILSYAITACGFQDSFLRNVTGFVDSLPLMKSKFPKLEKYTQEFLVEKFCHESYAAHNAEDDVRMLHKLLSDANVSRQDFVRNAYSADSHFLQENYNKCKFDNLPTLRVLISSGIMKQCTAVKVAGSGLRMNHLRLIYERNGEDGLTDVFCMKNSLGKTRVTGHKRVLGTCIPKLCEFFSKEE